MVSATERVALGFEGDGAGEGELSWGQLHLWIGMRRRKTWLPLEMIKPLPEGTNLDAAIADLRFMMSRYPSLRTRLRFGFADGLPRQVVAGSGELPVEVFDTAGGGEDPAALAAGVVRRYKDLPYDFTADWPLRAALVRHQGRLTHRVTVTCHLAIDGGSLPVIARDLAERDPRTGQAARPLSPTQSLALARWQRTPAARRQSEATIRHHEQILRTMPPRRLGESGDPRRPRYWRYAFCSPATHLAARAIAARAGTDQASVALTLWAVTLGRMTGVNPVVSRVVVSKRFRAQLADLVGPVIQDGLLMVDLAGIGFDEALVRTRRRAMSAYKYGFFDPRNLYDAEARISAERGEPVEVGCIFNDRRAANLDPSAAAAPKGPTVSRVAPSGPTASGPTASGPTASGPTASGPTASGPTASGPAASRVATSGAASNGPTADPTTADPAASGGAASGSAADPAGAPDLAEIVAALARTELACELRQDDDPHAPLFLHVNNVPGTIDITLLIDTHRIAPPEAERLLRELEALAVAAAADPATPTGIRATAGLATR
jgi:hypothetical protein